MRPRSLRPCEAGGVCAPSGDGAQSAMQLLHHSGISSSCSLALQPVLSSARPCKRVKIQERLDPVQVQPLQQGGRQKLSLCFCHESGTVKQLKSCFNMGHPFLKVCSILPPTAKAIGPSPCKDTPAASGGWWPAAAACFSWPPSWPCNLGCATRAEAWPACSRPSRAGVSRCC